MKSKTTRTYTIDDKLYEEFNKIIEKEKINRSKLIESLIINYINEYNKKIN